MTMSKRDTNDKYSCRSIGTNQLDGNLARGKSRWARDPNHRPLKGWPVVEKGSIK